MRRLLLFSILFILSCDKVDPRIKYVGLYDGVLNSESGVEVYPESENDTSYSVQIELNKYGEDQMIISGDVNLTLTYNKETSEIIESEITNGYKGKLIGVNSFQISKGDLYWNHYWINRYSFKRY